MNTTQPLDRRRSLWRKQLVIPAEHGSWSWLLVPYAVGAAVAGTLNLGVVLTLVAGLALFLTRQPATVWLRIRRGRGRRADAGPAATWVGILAGTAAVAGGALLFLGHTSLLWLAGPLAAILLLYLAAARAGRSGLRSLWMEVSGAAALAMTAAAAHITGAGSLTPVAWSLWAVLAVQNVLGALYVRLRLADSRGRTASRWGTVAAHKAGVVLVAALSLVLPAPIWVLGPFLAYLVRAGWAAAQPRPVENVRRFGFTELAVEIAGGLWIAIAYWRAM